MASLILKLKEKVLNEILLNNEAPTTIGRDPSNAIHLDNLSVSRFHAKIYKQGWPFFIEDLKSTNGVYVNEKKVSWKSPLSNNDIITIGKYTLIFKDKKSDYEDVRIPGLDATVQIKKN